MSEEGWRLVLPARLADPRQEALDEARLGVERYQREGFERTMRSAANEFASSTHAHRRQLRVAGITSLT